MKELITFFILTKNEEHRIEYTVRNLIGFGRVIILDGGSTDKTQEIAISLGAEFYARPDNTSAFVETEANLSFAKSLCKTNWIYWGYADNFLPKKLLSRSLEIINKTSAKQINIPLHTYLWGNTDHVAHKGYAPFLFHKEYVTFANNRIHGIGHFTGSQSESYFLPDRTEYAIKHFSTYTISKFISGHLRYAETESVQKFNSGERFSFLKTVAAMLRYFALFWRCGVYYGKLGVLIMLHYSYSRLLTYTRLYELEHNIDIVHVENSYSSMKKKLLKDFNE
jgi:glycosyltransferase involved in cell wall biosynthesis